MSNYEGNEFETYDVPKSAIPINYDSPKNFYGTANPQLVTNRGEAAASHALSDDCYDVPRLIHTSHVQPPGAIKPSSSVSSFAGNSSFSAVSSPNCSFVSSEGDYDVPRRNPIPVRPAPKQVNRPQPHPHPLSLSRSSNSSIYDFPLDQTSATPDRSSSTLSMCSSNNTAITDSAICIKELPLELSSALETLDKLQTEANIAITRLLSFVSPNWRLREKLEPVLIEVKLVAVRLRSVLHDLTEFGEGSLGNAARSNDRTLMQKLRPLVRALKDADKLVHDSSQTIEAQGGWTIEKLARCDTKSGISAPDSLDQLIACAQTLTEDVRQTASFIQGNALLLFNANILPKEDVGRAANGFAPKPGYTTNTTSDTTHNEENVNSEWLEDYDYVSFESKDMAAKKNSLLREAIPHSQKSNFDSAMKASEVTVMAAARHPPPSQMSLKRNVHELTDKDKLVVCYYAKQLINHMGNLQQAIDSFLETVEKNQPPKFFIAYGKFVVVSAHNLVTIGDIVHRNVSKTELREKILQCTDALADALKACVTKSKKAAAHFPSVLAVQDMVNSVNDISRLANELKNSMIYVVNLSQKTSSN